MDKRHKLIIVLSVLVAIALVVYTSNHRDEEEVPDSQTGKVDPNTSFVPATAIDTNTLPKMVFAASDDPQMPLPVYEILPNTYLFYGNVAQLDKHNRGANANAGFVITSAGVVVIDALGTPRLAQRLITTIRSITDKPITHLIVTHNHPDHAYGMVAFARLSNVTIIGHAGMVDYIGSETNEASVEYRRELIPEDMQGFETVQPDMLIETRRFSGNSISVGDRTFVIYNTGTHHSYGDLVVHQQEDNIVWISDLAFNQRLTYMGDGNSKQIIEGQDWLLEKFADAALMVPGHGSAQTSPFPMVTKTRNYVARLREAMAKAVEEEVGLLGASEYADFTDWHDTPLYEENHGRNAHFVYREMEEALF